MSMFIKSIVGILLKCIHTSNYHAFSYTRQTIMSTFYICYNFICQLYLNKAETKMVAFGYDRRQQYLTGRHTFFLSLTKWKWDVVYTLSLSSLPASVEFSFILIGVMAHSDHLVRNKSCSLSQNKQPICSFWSINQSTSLALLAVLATDWSLSRTRVWCVTGSGVLVRVSCLQWSGV